MATGGIPSPPGPVSYEPGRVGPRSRRNLNSHFNAAATPPTAPSSVRSTRSNSASSLSSTGPTLFTNQPPAEAVRPSFPPFQSPKGGVDPLSNAAATPSTAASAPASSTPDTFQTAPSASSTPATFQTAASAPGSSRFLNPFRLNTVTPFKHNFVAQYARRPDRRSARGTADAVSEAHEENRRDESGKPPMYESE